MTQHADMVGQLIEDHYRVERVLSVTQSGLLLQAENVLTQRRVALRWPLLHEGDAEGLREHFMRLSRVAVSVRHPHIADVLDMGLHEGTPFLVLEPLCGESLEQRLRASVRLSPAEVLASLLPILGAVAHLHDAGFVHGALDASQIFLCSGTRGFPSAKLVDVGTARPLSDASGSEATSHASVHEDISRLGALLYRCLTGEAVDGAARTDLGSTPRLLARYVPDAVPLAMALERAFRGEHERAYPSPREFAEALVAAARSSGIPLPEDPDPVGLGAYRRWLGDARPLEATVELERGMRPPFVSAPSVSARSAKEPGRTQGVAAVSYARVALVVCAVIAAIAWLGSLRGWLLQERRGGVADESATDKHRGDHWVQGARSSDGATSQALPGQELGSPGVDRGEPAGASEAGAKPPQLPRSPGGVAIEVEWK